MKGKAEEAKVALSGAAVDILVHNGGVRFKTYERGTPVLNPTLPNPTEP